LKEARQRVGVTQEALGIRAGIDEMVASSRMNHYEQGKHEPDFGTIHRIAAALGTSAAYFFCEDDELASAVWELTQSSRG
jgi:transcriptional regulator with XRE-family HTH domain